MRDAFFLSGTGPPWPEGAGMAHFARLTYVGKSAINSHWPSAAFARGLARGLAD